jgi:hypothetical protein
MTDETDVRAVDWMRGALRSKTVWFNALAAIFALLAMNVDMLSAVVPPERLGFAVLIVNVVNVALRAVTSSALPHK